MNDLDYDNDGNNMVDCPICLDQYCDSKRNEKCPKEDDYIKFVQTEKLE